MERILTEKFFTEYWENKHMFIESEKTMCVDIFGTVNFNVEPNFYLGKYQQPVKVFIPHRQEKKIFTTSDQAARLYREGATLYLVDYHKYDITVRKYLEIISKKYALGRARCSIFLASEGASMPLHWDSLNNFTLQICGKKRWILAENTYVEYPLANYSVGEVVPNSLSYFLGKTIEEEDIRGKTEVVMTPECMLYVPRGYWHGTETLENSISLSINFEALTVAHDISEKMWRLLTKSKLARRTLRAYEGERSKQKVFELNDEMNKILAEVCGVVVDKLNEFDPSA